MIVIQYTDPMLSRHSFKRKKDDSNKCQRTLSDRLINNYHMIVIPTFESV